jgi:hypothetical protein
MLGDKEQYYDDVIAPKLKEIAQLCQEKEIAMICQVEWVPGEAGRTVTLPKGASWQIRLAETAMRANGNVDNLFLACAKYAAVHGHESLVMKNMGVPMEPTVGSDAN